MGSISEFNSSWYHFVQAILYWSSSYLHINAKCLQQAYCAATFYHQNGPNCAQPNRELICLAASRRNYLIQEASRLASSDSFRTGQREAKTDYLSSPLLDVLKHGSCTTYIEYVVNEISFRVLELRGLIFWASSKVYYSGRRHPFRKFVKQMLPAVF
jgi:hypothetical protein